MLNLLPRYILIVKAILKAHIPQREVWVFGSRVTEKIKPYSDLDLAIMGDIPLTSKEISVLREAFDDSDLPFQVDIIDWAKTSEEFRSIIQANYEVIQAIK